LLRTAGARIDVTVAGRRALARPGLRLHRSTCLAVEDRAVARGIACTSVPRTLLDLARVVPPGLLERACDQADVEGLLDMDDARKMMDRSAGLPGVRRLRDVLHSGCVGTSVPRSELERRFLALCRRAGLPKPTVNEWIAVVGEEIQVDFAWHGPRVIVETDGFATHKTRWAFQRDRHRDRALNLAGWRVVRFTWEEVTNQHEQVTQVMCALLGIEPRGEPFAP
jgi:hypothetical protein